MFITNNNQREFIVPTDFKYELRGQLWSPKKFKHWIFRATGAKYESNVSGLSSNIQDRLFLVDDNNNEWIFDYDKDMFFREINGKQEQFAKDMLEETKKPGTLRFRYRPFKTNEDDLTNEITITIK